MKLSLAFKEYADDVIAFRNQSNRTEEASLTTQKLLVQFFGDIEIESLTFPMVRQWKQDLEKTRCPGTVRMYIIRLRVVLAYLITRKLDVLSPDSIPVPKRADRVPEFITKEEVSRLIAAVGKPQAGYNAINRVRNMAIVSFLYASGIRVSELTGLNKLDIHEDGSFTIIGKGGYARLCFLDQRSRTLLNTYLALRSDDIPALLLSTLEGARITPNTVQEIFRHGSRKAGFVKSVHPHTMRHSFATDLLKTNTNLYYVSKLLGHRQLNTTSMYLHVVDEDLRAVYNDHHMV